MNKITINDEYKYDKEYNYLDQKYVKLCFKLFKVRQYYL